jgi:hypothetical protein
MKTMYTVDEISKLIKSGKSLLLAGDEKVMKNLPQGNWIGGTIPYFISNEGGVFSQDKIYATEAPAMSTKAEIKVYDKKSVETVYSDGPENGFSVIIIPAMSETHSSFSLKAPQFKDFALRPLVGWISGVFLDDLGKSTPKIYDGRTGKSFEDGAVVMHIALPEGRIAEVGTVNIFKPSKGDVIKFEQDGFAFKEALVNGKKVKLADYLKEKKLDIRLPLVADYYGIMVNSSFQAVDDMTGEVKFYAPLFKGIEYRHADPFTDYVKEFTSRLPKEDGDKMAFSCNCILNYLYAELQGKKTGTITGPITFGEIGYQLLNQTMVFVTIL